MNNSIEEKAVTEILETYVSLRIIHPKAETAIERSMEIYGQISPVVCLKSVAGIELIDGFKRLRAARRLKWPTIKVVILETTSRACKAGMIRLNQVSRTITDIEEAMILHSLYRNDGLSQVEIASILDRDKSWVCRRISLIERLSENVRKNLELGLICVSVGRELAKLPRGGRRQAKLHQNEAMLCVLKHHLGKRDVEKLVRHLLSRSIWEYSVILYRPWAILSSDLQVPTRKEFFRQLTEIERLHQIALRGAKMEFLPENDDEIGLIRDVIGSGREVARQLEKLIYDREEEEPNDAIFSKSERVRNGSDTSETGRLVDLGTEPEF